MLFFGVGLWQFIEEISQRSRSSSPAARVKPHPPGGSGDPPRPPYKQEKHHLDKRVESLIAVAAAADDEDLLDTNAVAKWIGTTPQWLSIGRTNGYGPRFIKVSKRRVIYRRGDVRAWLRERTFASSDLPSMNVRMKTKPLRHQTSVHRW